MLAERVHVGLVAVVALAAIAVRPRTPAQVPVVSSPPAEVDGMRGPYASLGAGFPNALLDVMVGQGLPPFAEYTVVQSGEDQGGLGEVRHYTLAVRVGDAWWMRDLAFAGTVCVGQQYPVSSTVDVDAPRQHGDILQVHVVANMTQHDRRWTSESTTTCRVQSGVPHCT